MKHSKQRDTILKVIESSTVHPTADMVYELVKKDLPTISLGTVYRNLNLLSDLGVIKKICMPKGSDRFDKTIINHSHFFCDTCFTMYDIDSRVVTDMEKTMEDKTGHTINCHSILFVGICRNCKRKEG